LRATAATTFFSTAFFATLFATTRLATTGFPAVFATRLTSSLSFFSVLVWHCFPSLKHAAADRRDKNS
jgi:hypothetical protein